MSTASRILVASDNSDDAELVRSVLDGEFSDIAVSTDTDQVAADFDTSEARVLILAFKTLEQAESCYLGIYRLSASIHSRPHRTITLCSQSDLEQAFELCKRAYLDDYVLFWPIPKDHLRLTIAVHQALRALAEEEAAARKNPRQLAEQARRVAQSEPQLHRQLANGVGQIDRTGRALQQAEQDIGAALDRLLPQPTAGASDRGSLARDIQAFKSKDLHRGLKAVADNVDALQTWSTELQHDLSKRKTLIEALQSLAERACPLVLFVDDDEFQHKLLHKLLAHVALDLVCASSSEEAIGQLEQRQPELILMDVDMPDVSGIDLTRRIKAHESWAHIPIIMVTGHGNKEIVLQSREAGATDFVVKPFNRRTLLQKMAGSLAI